MAITANMKSVLPGHPMSPHKIFLGGGIFRGDTGTSLSPQKYPPTKNFFQGGGNGTLVSPLKN